MMLRVSLGASTTGTLVAGGAAGVTSGITEALATGSPLRGAGVAIGSTMMTLAPLTGPAAPFVAAAGAVISLLSNMFHGCGATCIQATEIANKFEQEFQQLKSQYFAQPIRTKTMQTAYLTAFDQTAQQMYDLCSNPQLGAAGQRCISERLIKGGSAPWCPTHTGCDWITTLRDPIANDTGVQPDPPASAGVLETALGNAASTAGGSMVPWLAVGLVVLGLVM
jgi:hypothetical protein